MIINEPFTALCNALAQQIEIAGRESGVTFSANQNEYGVTWECMIGDKWFRERDIVEKMNGEPVEAVRFFDCDGEQSDEATSVVEILEVAKEWIEINKEYYCEQDA